MGGLGGLLVVSLFLPWYSGCGTRSEEVGGAAGTVLNCRAGGDGLGEPFSAWSAFAVVDVVLAATGAVAVLALLLTLIQRTPAVPLALTSLGTPLAAVAAVLALIRVLAPPGAVQAAAGGSVWSLPGAWIGTGAALGLLAAMLASIRDERTPVPSWTLEEQAAAVRTLSLSTSGNRAPTDSGGAQTGGAS